jgi:hypothetical protein
MSLSKSQLALVVIPGIKRSMELLMGRQVTILIEKTGSEANVGVVFRCAGIPVMHSGTQNRCLIVIEIRHSGHAMTGAI